jgi:phage tail sheath gpL-like
MSISNAVDQNAVSSVTGFALGFKDFSEAGPNLPQAIAILSPVATAKQSGFTLNEPIEYTNAPDCLSEMGMSPAAQIMRILRPVEGGGVGSIKTHVFPVADAAGALASTGSITISMVLASKAVTHTVKFGGRSTISGKPLSFVVNKDDNENDVLTAIAAAINGNIWSPMSATVSAAVLPTQGNVESSGLSFDDTAAAALSATDYRLNFDLDGVTVETGDIDLSVASTVAETTAVINTALDVASIDAVFSVSGGEAKITSDSYGASSAVTVTSAPSAGTDLGALLDLDTGSTPTVTAGTAGTPGSVDLTSLWKGESANEIFVEVSDEDDAAGVVYTVVQPTGAAGNNDISSALAEFGEQWYTIVINPFGTYSLDVLETFNGAPDPDTGGTGRWNSIVTKPFVSLYGSTETDKDTITTGPDLRTEDLTNALCVAPGSYAARWEVAANWGRVFALQMNNNPHLVIIDKYLPDMPTPAATEGDFKDYVNRDFIVKKGVSTAVIKDGKYQIKDFVTHRHPSSQAATAIDWRYPRDIVGVDMNVIYRYRIVELRELKNKTIVLDSEYSTAQDTIKPKEWKGVLYAYIDNLVVDALINDGAFSKESIQVGVSDVNPKRFETQFYYKRSGVVAISATTAYAGFNYGS